MTKEEQLKALGYTTPDGFIKLPSSDPRVALICLLSWTQAIELMQGDLIHVSDFKIVYSEGWADWMVIKGKGENYYLYVMTYRSRSKFDSTPLLMEPFVEQGKVDLFNL